MKDLLKNPYTVALSFVIFLTPLIYTSNTNELYEFPKTFFVYSFVTVLFALFLLESIWKGTSIRRPALPVLLLILANIVSTLFSKYFYTSLWGYYTRFNGGLIWLVIMVGFYVVIRNRLRTEDIWHSLKLSLFALVPVSLYGLYQYFVGDVTRVYSTFGQPNWLAQYLVMLLPLCLFLFLNDEPILGGFLFLLGYMTVWVTFSLSGFLGLLASMLVLFFVLFKDLDRLKLIKLSVMAALCLLFSVLNPGIFSDKLHDALIDIKQATVVKVYAQDNAHKVSDPGFIRLEIWRSVFSLVTSSPQNIMFGTGPETFPYVYQPFRTPTLNYSSEWDFVLNKPHNYYLQLLVEVGLLGLSAYVFLLVWLSRNLPKMFIPSFVGFIVTNIFGWPVAATSILFWVFVSLAHIQYENNI